MKNTLPQSIVVRDFVSASASVSAASPQKRRTWAHTEGLPLPLGVTWIEEDQAFNFAVCAEHAESVKLFLYFPADLAKPVLTFQFDPIAISQGGSGTAGSPLIKCAMPAITLTRFQGRPLPVSAASITKRFFSIRMRNEFSSRRGLIASRDEAGPQ